MEKSILFCCAMNSIRSPMASAICNQLVESNSEYNISSAGVEEGMLDGFVISVMNEYGVDMMYHEPQSLAMVAIYPWEVIVVFCQSAYRAAEGVASRSGVAVELWEIEDPSIFEGNRDQKLDKYRDIRNKIEKKIIERFQICPLKQS